MAKQKRCWRNLAERFWSKVKQYRRVATRYEKKAINFLAFIQVAAIMVMLHCIFTNLCPNGLTLSANEGISESLGVSLSPRWRSGLVSLLAAFALSSPCLGQDKKPEKYLHIDLGGGVKMKLVRIEPGKFMMGSPEEEQALVRKEFHRQFGSDPGDWVAHEKQRAVEITKPFYMGVYAVTQHEYVTVMDKKPSTFSRDIAGVDTSRFPVECVSWDDAMEFCKQLSKLRGKTFDLPTEAEWEYACRAGSKDAFHHGGTLSTQANYNGDYPFGTEKKGANLKRPVRVGLYEPNEFNLYDMHGNVAQWCKDWHKDDYYRDSPLQDPQGPATGAGKVLRGGSWNSNALGCRGHVAIPSHAASDIGFRVVLRLP